MLAAPNHPTRPAETLAIPGLSESAPYLSRLSARSALYPEFHQLLSIQGEVLESAAYRKLVVDDNCLSKTSMSARVKHWQELKSRYRLDASDPLFVAFLKEWERCRSEPERSLTAYVLWALNDRLVADLAGLRLRRLGSWMFPRSLGRRAGQPHRELARTARRNDQSLSRPSGTRRISPRSRSGRWAHLVMRHRKPRASARNQLRTEVRKFPQPGGIGCECRGQCIQPEALAQ